MPEMDIIGTRTGSAFRVDVGYFNRKRKKFVPYQDPTTGGPLAVVYHGTDKPVPGARIVQGPPEQGDTGTVVVDSIPNRLEESTSP